MANEVCHLNIQIQLVSKGNMPMHEQALDKIIFSTSMIFKIRTQTERKNLAWKFLKQKFRNPWLH